MIVDKLENANLYTGISERLTRAFEILKDTAITDKANGRYDVDGDNLYYIVARYTTKPLQEGLFEAHKKYIDVQFIAAGREIIDYAPMEAFEIDTPYNAENDAILYKAPDNFSTIELNKGMFCVFFPDDTHMPGHILAEPCDICKIVIKIRIDN